MMLTLIAQSLVGAAVMAGVAAEADSPLIDDAALQSAGLYEQWEAHVPIGPQDSLKEGYLVDELLYVITDRGSLYALTADAGLLRWGANLTEPDCFIYRPAHIRRADGSGPVVIPTTSGVFLYDRFSGDLIQSFAPAFAVGGPAVAFDENLFMGGSDGRFYSLKLLHQVGMEPFKQWEVLAGGPVTAAPVLYDYDMMLFASQGGRVYSCRAEDKVLNWTFRTGGAVMGDPAVDESGAYVASTDRSLYKLHLGSGQLIWRVRLPRPLFEGPIVTAHTVYQFCVDHGLVAIDADTGDQKWRNPDGRAFVAHSRDSDIIFTGERSLQIVDHETGEVRHTIAARAAFTTVANTRDDAVYVLAQDGRVSSVRLDSVPYLRRQQVIAARRQLNVRPHNEVVAPRAPETSDEKPARNVADPLRSRRDVRP